MLIGYILQIICSTYKKIISKQYRQDEEEIIDQMLLYC